MLNLYSSNLATLMCAPAAPLILKDFGSSNLMYGNFLVSVWELGEAFGPLVLAPLSELYGRSPIYHCANIGFIIFSIAGALSVNLNMLIAFRFLNGVTVASVTLGPSIVGDLFITEERATAMAIMNLAPLLGPVAGPIVGGYMSQNIGWRWLWWFVAILAGVLEVGFIRLFRETYKVKILQQKAIRLQKATGNLAYKVEYKAAAQDKNFLLHSMLRPLRMLIFSPVVSLLAVYVALVFGYLYLLLTSITEVFEDIYGFSTGTASLTFLGLGIGMTVGLMSCGRLLDRYVQKMKAAGGMKPEHRLPPMILGGLVIPISLFLYGWTAQYRLHWIAPVIGTALLGFGVAATIIPAFSYLVDAFGIHAASAVAANITLRCVTGALLPLAGPPLYQKLGVGWGNSLLGFIALAFAPMPLLLMKYGERIRKSSKYQVVF